MTGCAAHLALDPAALTSFIDHHSEYRADKRRFPQRMRKYINGHELATPSHARMIRRWKQANGGVTAYSAERLLAPYGLTLADLSYWCEVRTITPTIRGSLPQ